jgi:serine protease
MLRPAFWVLLTLAACPALAAPEWNPVPVRAGVEAPVERLIIKLRPATPSAAAASAIEALGTRTGVLLAHAHSITREIHVARLLRSQQGAELEATLARLRADAAVAYADPDRRKQAHDVVPNDPLYVGTPGLPGQTGQWYMQAPQSTPAGTTTAAVNAAGAWSITTGSNGVVIADLDTGIRFDHPDLMPAGLGGKLLPGYDLVGCDGGGGNNCPAGSTYNTANNGHGWGPDPSDPGDWISAADVKIAMFAKCTQENSSWHGTRTAGILGALTDNFAGIAGMAWNSWVLPVRVLGKCGGYDSDIIAGMLWAAGLPVEGVPTNPYPASILNMSLGSPNACGSSYPDAISQVAARGVVVVVSAGNEGGPVDEPANCAGAIGVVGVRHVGSKVGYSSLGGEAALAAPAGNCVNTGPGLPCLFSIDTTTNLGTTTPGTNSYTDQMNYNVGTSFSAPIVSGISALMLGVNGNLSPPQLLARLRTAARTFPVIPSDDGVAVPACQVPSGFSDNSQAVECNCTTATCGAGLADALGSVNEALRPIAAIAAPATVSPGQTVQLGAAGSAAACGHSVASYAWSIIANSSGAAAALTATTAAATSLTAPASGTITVQLVVSDDQGAEDTATIVVGPTTTTTTAPASAGSRACLAAVVPPAPTVSISVVPASIAPGQSATLTWSSTNAVSCAASGAWSGAETASGSQPLTPSATTGSLSYALACTGSGGTATGAATLAISAGGGGGGGGGALDAGTLALGALLGAAARRRRATRDVPTR